jgi:hypothetical protein
VLLLAMLAASCNFDAAFQSYCDGSGLCSESAPGGSGGSAGSIEAAGSGGGGSGGDGGGGGGGSGGDETAWSAPQFCDRKTPCPDGLVCNSYQHECAKPCEANAECRFPEQWCKTWGSGGFTVKGCSCANDLDCKAGFPDTSTFCHPYTLRCERPCVRDADCERADGRPFCYKPSETGPGACVGCLSHGDCPVETPICNLESPFDSDFQCRGCFSDDDCRRALLDGRTHCNKLTSICVMP